jgi:protein FRA10AC1
MLFIVVFVPSGFKDAKNSGSQRPADRCGASSKSSGNSDEAFEEYLEGMFP